jgi:DtxR family transcriptional regulator, Mn-dependent transcriptional regulator
MKSATRENYLKAIYKLLEKNPQGVSTNAIAERLETKAATVTDMLKKLSAQKLINYKRYYGVTLTPSGKKSALMIIRSHRLWELFLVQKLNFGWDQVHEVAEQLEHVQSDLLIARLDEFLEFPRFDPHGDPIPDQDGKIVQHRFVTLSKVELGKVSILSGVVDHSDLFLRYLNQAGMQLGQEIKVMKIEPYDQSMEITINKKTKMNISPEVARNLLVAEKEN